MFIRFPAILAEWIALDSRPENRDVRAGTGPCFLSREVIFL